MYFHVFGVINFITKLFNNASNAITGNKMSHAVNAEMQN